MAKSFPRPLADIGLTVDVVVLTFQDGGLKVLLTKRISEPFAGRYALPGAFLWQDETTQETAQRALHDKAGVDCDYMEQLYTFDALDRDSRRRIISVTYLVLLHEDKFDGALLERHGATLFDVAQKPELPFDHEQILKYALQRLRSKLTYTNIAYALLPKLFTLSSLQKTYEVILGHSLDKRNFRKKLLATDLLQATDEKQAGTKHRPALLYKFTSSKPVELELPLY